MQIRSWLLLLLCMIGCRSVSGPDVDGVYVIESVDGKPLPALLFSDVGGWKVTILSGELTIANERYNTRSTVRREFEGNVTVAEVLGQARVTVSGREITLTGDTPGADMVLTIMDDQTLVGVGVFVSARIQYRKR